MEVAILCLIFAFTAFSLCTADIESECVTAEEIYKINVHHNHTALELLSYSCSHSTISELTLKCLQLRDLLSSS